MSKKAKILIILILMSFSVIFLLIFSSKPVVINDEVKNKKNDNVDLAALEVNYKNNVKKILVEYEQSISSSSESALNSKSEVEAAPSSTPEKNINSEEIKSEKILELKNKLLSLTVPPVSALMDLHVSLVLAFSKMESYLASNNIKEYRESADSIKLAKNNNQWLNQ